MDIKQVKTGEKIFKVFEAEVKDESPNDEIQLLSFTISSNRRDRDRDIVEPEGAQTADYGNNPVMLWAHQYDRLPIARAVEMTRVRETHDDGNESHKLKALVTFQPDSNYHESYTGVRGSMVYKMYKTGFLNAVSIGFNPLAWEPVEEKDGEDDENMGSQEGVHFTKYDILEFSAVPVPANPDALVDRSFKKQLKHWAEDTVKACSSPDCNKGEKPMIEKAGAVLSSKNKEMLKTASDNILQVLAAAEPATPAEEPLPEEAPPKIISYPLGHDAPIIKESEPEIIPEPEVDGTLEVVATIEVVEPNPDDELVTVDEALFEELVDEVVAAQLAAETDEESPAQSEAKE